MGVWIPRMDGYKAGQRKGGGFGVNQGRMVKLLIEGRTGRDGTERKSLVGIQSRTQKVKRDGSRSKAEERTLRIASGGGCSQAGDRAAAALLRITQ